MRKPRQVRSERELPWLALITAAILWPIEAAMSMVFLGAAHGQDARVPDFGFWTMFFIDASLGSVISGSMISIRLYIENINRRLEQTL